LAWTEVVARSVHGVGANPVTDSSDSGDLWGHVSGFAAASVDAGRTIGKGRDLASLFGSDSGDLVARRLTGLSNDNGEQGHKQSQG
jgi:hypothetical protein